jgi:hypothetical protein
MVRWHPSRSPGSLSTFDILLVALYTIVTLSTLAKAKIISKESGCSIYLTYRYAYYYDDDDTPPSQCDSAVMINVGTFMSIKAYSKLARSIVDAAASSANTSTIVFIVDSNYRKVVKDSGAGYAKVTNAIAANIAQILPQCTSPPLYFIGGHSAGGKGAINAMHENRLNFSVAGFVGLDPYKISNDDRSIFHINVPSLHWGFSKTSCLVTRDDAAMASYNISNPNYRIFYQVQTNHNPYNIIAGPHCSFTNNGCIRACLAAQDLPWIRTQVGVTFNRFVLAVKSNNFERSQFLINETEVVLIVNED